MSQINAPVRRASGGLDVYTGLLGVALIVLAAGVFLMATKNIEHSAADARSDGGVFQLVEAPRR